MPIFALQHDDEVYFLKYIFYFSTSYHQFIIQCPFFILHEWQGHCVQHTLLLYKVKDIDPENSESPQHSQKVIKVKYT